MQLTGRVCLVTGGRRIGGVVATALAQAGADIGLVYFSSRAEAEQTAQYVEAAGRRIVLLQGDLRQVDVCEQVVEDLVEALGRIDVLVNMASLYQSRPFDDISVRDWDNQLAVDLRASWLCAKAAVPHMRRLRGGRIINCADWVAHSRRPRYPGYLTYYVAKSAVMALTEALALELAPDQILVNAVAPGPIVPPDGTTADEFASVERATPLGRWGGEAEIAKAVLALVDSDFMTGETIRVDGGRHLR